MQILELTKMFVTGSDPVYSRPISKGKINETHLVDLADGSKAIVQKINAYVFPKPEKLMANAQALAQFLPASGQAFPLLQYYRTINGAVQYVDSSGGFWRAYKYVDGTITDVNSVANCAKLGHMIGMFHRTFEAFPVEQLSPAIPHFHNTPKRFQALVEALAAAPPQLKAMAANELKFLQGQEKVCGSLLTMDLIARVTHNDVQLSNMVLDNETGNPLCLIDYDTVMPGVFAFDFGDGARSSCTTAREDEADISKIQFNIGMFEAFTNAYVAQTKPILEENEPASLAMGAVIMALELGIRYMTDFLTGNRYFRAEYPEQNLNRARVQLLLCLQMQQAYPQMVQIVKAAFQK